MVAAPCVLFKERDYHKLCGRLDHFSQDWKWDCYRRGTIEQNVQAKILRRPNKPLRIELVRFDYGSVSLNERNLVPRSLEEQGTNQAKRVRSSVKFSALVTGNHQEPLSPDEHAVKGIFMGILMFTYSHQNGSQCSAKRDRNWYAFFFENICWCRRGHWTISLKQAIECLCFAQIMVME